MKPTAQSAIPIVSASHHAVVGEFLVGLLAGDRAKCSALTWGYLGQNPSIKDLYEEVFKVALYEVGRLWETNRISVASEHLATAITEGILNELFDQISAGQKSQRKVVVACVENEQHQVGIKMVADLFELRGWESFFLGAGIPTTELVMFVRETRPDMLAISLTVYFNFTCLLRMLELLRKEFPALPIILGGQAFCHVSEAAVKRLEVMKVFHDLNTLDEFLEQLNRPH